MVTYKLSSQFAPRARGLPFLKQNRRVPGGTVAAAIRLLPGKLSLPGPSDADKTGEEMLPRCRNGDDCHQRKPKLRLTGRDGPPGLYDQKVTGGSACPVSPAVVWFATQQPATAGTRKDLSASAGPDNVGMYIGNAGPDNVRRKEGNAGPARLKSFPPDLCHRAGRRGLTTSVGRKDNVGNVVF